MTRSLSPDLTDCRIGFGHTVHRRTRPVERRFTYRSFFAELGMTPGAGRRGNYLFGINRTAILSFHDADHGDGRPPHEWITDLLARKKLPSPHKLQFRGFVRVFGYAFKPVSFWFCLNESNERIAIVAEVNNTFGERHYYLLEAGGQALSETNTLLSSKNFHVSPFFDKSGYYRFRFNTKESRSIARVDYYDRQGLLLATSLGGEHHRINVRSVARAVIAYPMFTLGVVARIHWQAVLLWVRRVPFHSKPDPDSDSVSTGGPSAQRQTSRFLS